MDLENRYTTGQSSKHPLKIQSKIVIPFTLILIVATFVTSLLSISFMSRTLQTRMRTRLEQASQMISRADFALNSGILMNLKTVIAADVITYNANRTVL